MSLSCTFRDTFRGSGAKWETHLTLLWQKYINHAIIRNSWKSIHVSTSWYQQWHQFVTHYLQMTRLLASLASLLTLKLSTNSLQNLKSRVHLSSIPLSALSTTFLWRQNVAINYLTQHHWMVKILIVYINAAWKVATCWNIK